MFLEDGDIAELTRDGRRARPTSTATPRDARAEDASPGTPRRPRRRLPALHAQGDPRAAARHRPTPCAAGCSLETRRRRSWTGSSSIRGELERVVLLACGTSYHAGLVGKFLIERLAAHPVRGRPGQRVPLPRPGGRARAIWSCDLAERRDRRHAGARSRRRRRAGAACWPSRNVVDSAIPRASRRRRSTPTPGRRSAWPRPSASPRSWRRCAAGAPPRAAQRRARRRGGGQS